MVLLHQQKRRPATQFTRGAPPRAAAARRGTYTRPMVVISVRVPLPAGMSEAAAYAALSDPRRAPGRAGGRRRPPIARRTPERR